MALTLTFDQADAGLPAGIVDRARTDLVSTGHDETTIAWPVVITVGGVPDGASADIALLDEPPESHPLLTQLTPTTWRLEFDKGVWGPFRVRARAVSSGNVLSSVTRRCSIRSPKFSMQYPANAERIDPNASSVASTQSVALTEMNEGGTNRALVDFYRELIERVEAAAADGSLVSPPLFEQLYDDSLEHISGKYRVQAALQTLINGAVQLADRRLDFVYKLDALQGDDVTVQMLNLRDKLQSEGGGVILLPPKVQFKTTRGLNFDPSDTRTAPIAIVGRHGYRSQWFYMPDLAHAEEPCMHFGFAEGADTPFAYGDIALAHFDLNTSDGGAGPHYGEQASGIEFYAINNSLIHDVRTRSFKRGVRLFGNVVNGNTQEIHLLNVLIATCFEAGLELDVTSNITAHRLYCAVQQPTAKDVLIKDADNFLWSGGCIQSNAPYGVYAETIAGKNIRCIQIDHVYNETTNASRVLWYFGVGAGAGAPTASITNCQPQGAPGGGTIYKLQGASGARVTMTSRGNVSGYGNPATVVLDAEYADIFTDHDDVLATQYGTATYNIGSHVRMVWGGSRIDRGGANGSISIGLEPARSGVALQLAGGAFALAPYVEGLEPSAAIDNDMVARPDGPAVKLEGSWHRLAFAEEINQSMTALLAPYASEIFDLGATRLVEVISGEVNSLTGVLYGDVLSAPSSGRRPAYAASDAKFRGAPALTSSSASSGKYLIGDLSHGSVIGDTPALLCVGYKVGSTAASLRAFMALQNAAGNGNTMVIAADDPNAANYWYAIDDRTAVSGINFATLTTEPMDEFARVAMAWQKPAEGLQLRVNSRHVSDGPTQGPNDVAMPKAVLGACWTGSAITAETVTITLAVYLKNTPPQAVIDKVYQLLQDRYGAF